jgi:hypothetical protein
MSVGAAVVGAMTKRGGALVKMALSARGHGEDKK